MNDFLSHCSWIQPSSPEVLLCLQANAAALSPSCQIALRALPPAAAPAAAAVAPPTAVREPPPPHPVPAPPPRAPQTVARPAPPPPPAAVAAPRQPTPEQIAAIRAACRSDFMSHCPGVQPGGAEALQCLERNRAQLAPPCQGAVAAAGNGPPSGSAVTAARMAPAAAPPPVPPLVPMPPLPLRVEVEILRVCGADQRALCAGVPPGGGRIMTCLAEHAPALTPACYGAMAAARR